MISTFTANSQKNKEKPDRPNIVIVMADDMGFSYLGCYGGEISTPNIDKLADNGIRFSQFYNSAVCGPSRAALLTGLYNHQAGVRAWNDVRNDKCVNFGQVLSSAGYHTMMVGKWTHNAKPATHFGFDRFFGLLAHKGPINYWTEVSTAPYFLNNERYRLPAEGFFLTERLTDYALDFLDEAANQDKPFLLYAAYLAPHWLLHAREKDIQKYRKLYTAGWDEIRKRRFDRLKSMGLIESECRLTDRDTRVSPWEQAEDKNWQVERMATYAAQIECLDRNIERILTKVKDMGAEDNTIVIFLSDNGASDQGGPKNGFFDIPNWRLDGTAMRTGNDPSIMPGPGDTFTSYGPEWGNVSNTPFRQYKVTNHEGGIATPLIVRWPAVIKQTESVTPQVGHVIDIMATVANIAGAKYPSIYQGRNILPLEGKSLLPVFLGQKRDGHRVLCWEFSGTKAIRMDKWKLIALRNRPWELYNMESDRTEISNLAAQHPNIVKQMEKEYQTWATRCYVTDLRKK
jgi:arylsulfatase